MLLLYLKPTQQGIKMAVGIKIPVAINQLLTEIQAEREKASSPITHKTKIIIELIRNAHKKECKSCK